MQGRSDTEVPSPLLNLLELPLKIGVHYLHQVVENHLELDLVQDPLLQAVFVHCLMNKRMDLLLDRYDFVVTLIIISNFTWAITFTITMRS